MVKVLTLSTLPASPSDKGSLPKDGSRPVAGYSNWHVKYGLWPRIESDCLRVQSKLGGKLLLRLNTMVISIANKYREGKLQSTLKREFKRT